MAVFDTVPCVKWKDELVKCLLCYITNLSNILINIVRMRKIVTVLIPVLICFCVGFTASYFQMDAIQTWYPTLNKPALTPPNIVFPIAWSIIYLCMGVSVGLVILTDKIKKKKALITLFAIQLFLNFAWSILFFYFRNPLLGLADILLLDIFVILYTVKCYPEKRISSFLFMLYAIWLFFATYLNGYILLNN